MPSDEKSYVQVVSNGKPDGTRVFLVIVDGEGHELRYRIPNVRHSKMEFSRGAVSLELEIGNARAGVILPIGMGKKTTAGDLLAEVAAAKLVGSKGDEG